MQTPLECGPTSQYNAIQKHQPSFNMAYSDYLKAWGFPCTGTPADNLHDQPGDHLTMLRKLNILHRRVTLNDLIARKCPEGMTVVLLHNPKDPILMQHWVRFVSYDRLSGLFHFDWGDGNVKSCNAAQLKESFEAGLPDYAYCVGEAETSKNKRTENFFWLMLNKVLSVFK